MSGDETDPVETVENEMDLYEIATWEPRSALDTLSVVVYRLLVAVVKLVVVLLSVVILFAIGGIAALEEPAIGLLTAASVVPALALFGYVWYSDVTATEPVSLLAATFVLAVLMAGFAAVLNGLLQPWFSTLGVVGLVLFFYVVVGPVEETVKLLAVRLYAYEDDRFGAVVDGAVYGAVAGLGFATIENALYISRAVGEVAGVPLGLGLIGIGGDITATRALAGPGHVVYSAFAGYYLGLAKFNPENRGPIIVKGLLLAAFIHGTYNATVGLATGVIVSVTGLPQLGAFVVYVLLYVGVFTFLLYRKIERYNTAYRATRGDRGGEHAPDV